MTPIGVQAIDEAPVERPAPAEQDAVANARSRRLLRAVEQYRAACAARGEPAPESERWLVLLAALNGSDEEAAVSPG